MNKVSTFALCTLALLMAACVKKTVYLCDEHPEHIECVCPADPSREGCELWRDAGPPDANIDAGDACGNACTGETPICDGEHATCVGCLAPDDCDEATPICDESSHTCVQCGDENDCGDKTPVCDTTDNTCVECAADINCADTAAGHCQDDRTCGACTMDEQCARFSDTPVCDEDSGACVACTTDTEETQCGSFSCNPTTLSCTTTARASLGFCEACVSDSECSSTGSGTRRCVPVRYMDAAAGTYCLVDRTTSPGEACPRGYPESIEAESVGGVVAEYCYHVQSLTNCEAILSFRMSCEDAEADCGSASFAEDSLCQNDGAGNLCTYKCGGDLDCPSGFNCAVTEIPHYCRTAS